MVAGCSVLAPHDDELLGGEAGRPADASVAGGTAGTSGAGGTTKGGSAGDDAGTDAQGGGGGVAAGGSAGSNAGGSATGGAGGAVDAGTGGTGGTTCVPSTGPATARAVAMYAIVDNSGSMGTQGKWTTLGSGLHSFVTSAPAAGTDFALEYLSLSESNTCAGLGWDVPKVPFAPLPQQVQAIDQAMATLNPNGTTNFEGPFNGATQVRTAYAAQHPDTQFVVVFPTDFASVSQCNTSIPALQLILSNSWPALSWYFISLPGIDATAVASLAASGGTVAPINATANTASVIASALEKARTPCRFAIPSAGSPSLVRYVIIPGGNGLTASYLDAPTSCGTSHGWFAWPAGGNTAVLCPHTCQSLAAAQGASVQVSVECP
jgi:hypothetical protein